MRKERQGIHRLVPHPATAASFGAALYVEVFKVGDDLELHYVLGAELGGLRIPEAATGQRRDGLWRGTCFEAFAAGDDWPAYREFNFSPSGAWAAYDFARYRAGARPAAVAAPGIVLTRQGDQSRLAVTLRLADLPPGERLRLGLAAVLETAESELHYWALRHPAGRPDFHHRESFAVDIALPRRGDEVTS